MKLFLLAAAAASLAALTLAGCATAPPIPKGATGDAFVIEEDLLGVTQARGEFRSVTGVRRGFDARLEGSWDGSTLTLVEDFVFDDGQKDRKTWRLTRVAPGRYVGTREDVVGEARGWQDGPVFRLEYDMKLDGRVLRFRDVMAEMPAGEVRNDATVGWRGLRVGRVSLVIRKP